MKKKNFAMASMAAVTMAALVPMPVHAETLENPSYKDVAVTATQASSFSVSIPKNVGISGNSGTYEVGVSGSLAPGDTVTIKPIDQMADVEGINFPMKQAGVADVTATISQPNTSFTAAGGVNNEGGQKEKGTITVTGMGPGTYEGTFQLEISYNIG